MTVAQWIALIMFAIGALILFIAPRMDLDPRVSNLLLGLAGVILTLDVAGVLD